MSLHFPFDNSFAGLGEDFYSRVAPSPVSDPRLLRLNRPLARSLGLDDGKLDSREGAETLAGNRIPEGAEPLAMVYAGHQFGNFVPQLGDGRAILLGELVNDQGIRRDLQLKGAGRTPYSRMGDGRAGLGPVMREYIISEAMAALGIPTTRALAMVTTGEPVYREKVERGAILTRVASSHIRVGTFEYFHQRGHTEAIRSLADYVIERHYPELKEANHPYRSLLETVCKRTAELVAAWMQVGFIHGVMNTDNMSVAGETIDYGPCAFMDTYHPHTVFSSIDQGGRYAYGQQPRIGQWNMARFAESLLPLLAGGRDTAIEEAQTALDTYASHFETVLDHSLAQKIGLFQAQSEDCGLAWELLERMAEQQADFTLVFRRLCDVADPEHDKDEAIRSLFADPSVFDEWAEGWRRRLADDGEETGHRQAMMRRINPAFIPRNHRVDEAITAATEADDFAPMEDLLQVVTDPWRDHPGLESLALPPEPHEVVQATFCGT